MHRPWSLREVLLDLKCPCCSCFLLSFQRIWWSLTLPTGVGWHSPYLGRKKLCFFYKSLFLQKSLGLVAPFQKKVGKTVAPKSVTTRCWYESFTVFFGGICWMLQLAGPPPRVHPSDSMRPPWKNTSEKLWWKLKMPPWKREKNTSTNHPFLGTMLVFGGVYLSFFPIKRQDARRTTWRSPTSPLRNRRLKEWLERHGWIGRDETWIMPWPSLKTW